MTFENIVIPVIQFGKSYSLRDQIACVDTQIKGLLKCDRFTKNLAWINYEILLFLLSFL